MSLTSSNFTSALQSNWGKNCSEFEKDILAILHNLGFNLEKIEHCIYIDFSKSSLFIIHSTQYLSESDVNENKIKGLINDIINKNTYNVDELYFCTNNSTKFFTAELIQHLESHLKTIFPKSKVKILHLSNTFYKWIEGLISEKILSSIKKTNQQLSDEYKKSMEMDFYFSGISFEWENRNHTRSKETSPLSFLSKKGRFNNNHKLKGSSPKAEWTFVISEFGFGKTSLLTNLWVSLYKKSVTPIYIPIAQLSKEGLQNETNFCREVLSIVTDYALIENKNVKAFYEQIFKNMMHSEKNMALLLDGLDEHHFAYMEKTKDGKQSGLQLIFNTMAKLVPILIFTVRKEFWDEKYNNLQLAIGKSKNQRKIYLIEWSNNEIIEYLKMHIKREISLISYENIIKFKNIVENNEYELLYGDIPKRPLFLKMLLSDISNGTIQVTNLAKLYESYLAEKFYRDRHGSSGKGERLFNMNENTALKELFEIQEDVAGEMVFLDEKINANKTIEIHSIDEQVVEKIIEDKNLVEILNHSVLMTMDKRQSNLKLRFAHKSFQDYFLARLIIRILAFDKIPRNNLILTLPLRKEIIKFIVGILDNSPENVQKKVSSFLDKFSQNQNYTLLDFLSEGSLLYDMVKICISSAKILEAINLLIFQHPSNDDLFQISSQYKMNEGNYTNKKIEYQVYTTERNRVINNLLAIIKIIETDKN